MSLNTIMRLFEYNRNLDKSSEEINYLLNKKFMNCLMIHIITLDFIIKVIKVKLLR